MRPHHPFAVPTVGLFVEAPAPNQGCPQGSWRWARIEHLVPAREYIYSKRDLCRCIRSYGPVLAYSLANGGPDRFRIVARGLFTMRFLAEYVWRWQPHEGRYVPAGAPWIVWPPLNELPAEVRLGAKRTGQLPGDGAPECPSCE